MKFLDNIKSMFTNKEDVTSFRASKSPITSTFIDTHIIKEPNYKIDMIIYWGLKVDKDALDQWMQVSELFKGGYKIYPFQKHYIILLSLLLDDIKYAFENCRFANNLIMDALRTTIEFEIPLKCFELACDINLDKYGFARERFIRPYKEMNLDYDDNDDKIIEQEAITHGMSNLYVPYVTDVKDLISKILFAFSELTLYLSKNDVYDLARVVVTIKMSALGTFLKLYREDYIKAYEGLRDNPDKYLTNDDIFDAVKACKIVYDEEPYENSDLFYQTKEVIIDKVNKCNDDEYLYPLSFIKPTMFIYNFKQIYHMVDNEHGITPELEIFQIDLINILNKYGVDVDDLVNYLEPTIYKAEEDEDTSNTEEEVEVIDTSEVPESNKV